MVVAAEEAEVDGLCRAVAVMLTNREVPVAATLSEAVLRAEADAAEGVESKETVVVPVNCALADDQVVADKVGVKVAVELALYEKAAIDAVGKAEAVPGHCVGEELSLAWGLSDALRDKLPVAVGAEEVLTEAEEVAVVVPQAEVLCAAEPLEERVASGETEAVVEGVALVLVRGDLLKDGDSLPKAVLDGEGEEKRQIMPVGLPEGHPEAEGVAENILKALEEASEEALAPVSVALREAKDERELTTETSAVELRLALKEGEMEERGESEAAEEGREVAVCAALTVGSSL